MKKAPVIAITLIASVLIILGSVYWILKGFQKQALQHSQNAFIYIPDDAAWVLQVHSPALFLESLIKTGTMSENLSFLLTGKNQISALQQLDSLIINHTSTYEKWKNAGIIVSGHPASNDFNFHYLIQIIFPAPINEREINGFINQHFSTRGEAGSYEFEGARIFSQHFSHDRLHFVISDNSLRISTSVHLSEQSLRAAKTNNNILANEDFAQLKNVSGRFSDNFFWNMQGLCDLLNNQDNFQWPLSISCHTLTGWHAWDISYNNGQLIMNGFTAGVPNNPLLALPEPRQPSQLWEFIPMHPSMLFYLNTEKPDAIMTENLLKDSLSIHRFETYCRRFQDIARIPAKSIMNIWQGELGWVISEGISSNQNVVILHIDNPDHLLDHPALGIFFRTISDQNEVINHPVWKNMLPGLLPILSRGIISHDFEYITFIGSSLLAANSSEVLNDYIEKLKFGHNFNRNASFKLMQEDLLNRQNVFLHFSFPQLISVDSQEQYNHLSSLGNTSLQMLPTSGALAFSQLLWHYQPDFSVSNPVLWSTNLLNPVLKGPFQVISHLDHSHEIIVQDTGNILYLLDQSGKILWQKELSGPIMSQIFQVDIYKNNRYQYAFNTRNFLHVIDRNGNYVTGYPFRLPSPATAGISVFDYDRNKNYRILFPAENRKIYNYSLARRPVSGWRYGTSRSIITSELQYMRLKGKDYIFAIDTLGHLEILNRQGLSRINPRQIMKTNQEIRIFANDASSDPYFVVAGKQGNITHIYPSGNVVQFATDTLPRNFSFVYDNFTGGKEKEMIFLHRNTLTIYTDVEKFLFPLPVNHTDYSSLKIYDIPQLGKLAAMIDPVEKLIFLINAKGEILYPSPVSGEGYFYFDNMGDKNVLITRLDNSIVCYKIN